MALLDLSTTHAGGVVSIALAGELDLAGTPAVEQALKAAEGRKPGVLALDLRRLEFIDSTGLRVILNAQARAEQGGWRFALVRGPETVRRIFALTGLEDRLDFVDDPRGLASVA